MLLLAKAITQNFSNPTNNRLRASSNTRNQAVVQGDRVNIQSRNSGNVGRNNRRAYVQGEVVEGMNATNETANVQRIVRTPTPGNTSTGQCYNCGGKGHYARNCPKPRVRDSKYFMLTNVLANRNEPVSSSINENDEQIIQLNTKIINSTIDEDQIIAIFNCFVKENVNKVAVLKKKPQDYDQCALETHTRMHMMKLQTTKDFLKRSVTESISKDIKEMKEAIEQNDVYLDEIERQNNLLKDQLLEASLKHDIELYNAKMEYKKLFDSIKKTRSQTQKEMDELITHVSEKTYAYGAIRAENQNLLVTIFEFESKNEKCENRMNATSSVKRPKSRDSHVKTNVLDVSNNEAKKEAVYVRKNKQTDNTFAKVVSNKENVIDVVVETASKAKTLQGIHEKATQSKDIRILLPVLPNQD
ncbi:retrovirus-related pol polyprotein from transposon TNT 1-94 [Tanacetum coccineum]